MIRRSYNDTWDYYISKYVIEEDREALKAAILIENVKNALEKSDEYSCSYRILADNTGSIIIRLPLFVFIHIAKKKTG